VDTRKKILTPAAAESIVRQLRESGVKVSFVTGHFDPVLAWHGLRLASARTAAGALVVIVNTPASPVLQASARAELVAALAVVDYVVLPEGETVDDLLARLDAVDVVRLEPDDERLTRDLIRHVHSRQHAS
jgi:bifunctional ADP-heptose synthase (sugar kinase/adenylyltransferase)